MGTWLSLNQSVRSFFCLPSIWCSSSNHWSCLVQLYFNPATVKMLGNLKVCYTLFFFFQRLSYCRSSYIASTLVHSPTSHTCMYVHTHTLVHVVFRKAIKLLIVPTPNLVIFLVDFHHFFGVWQHVNYVLIVLVITHLFCRFWWLLCS